MSKAIYKTYGTHNRGMRVQLKERVHVKFSDESPVPHLCRIMVQDEDGNPVEAGLEKAQLLEKTNGFQKGAIFYVPSPDEMRAKQKREAQEVEANKYRELLGRGVLKLDLEDKDMDYLREFADSIGAKVYDANGKPLSKLTQQNAIYGVLGVTPPPRGDVAKQRKAKERENAKEA